MKAAIIRPSIVGGSKKITFLWSPKNKIVELVYRPGEEGLCFTVSEPGREHYFTNDVDGLTPLKWVESYARMRALRLPSGPSSYGTLTQLAESMKNHVRRYYDSDEEFRHVAVLYALHTWVYECFHAVPYLRFFGLSGTGKTRGTETIGAICYHPLFLGGSATSASMFRLIEATGGTLLLDEADFLQSQIGSDVIKVLNSGYQQGFPVTRMEMVRDEYEPRLYSVFGPKIINGRKKFQDDATESRCLSYTPSPSHRIDIPTQLTEDFHLEANEIQNQALSWRLDTLATFKVTNQHMAGLSRRGEQIALPLHLIADQLEEPARSEYKQHLLAFFLEIEDKNLQDRNDSIEAKVLKSYCTLSGNGAIPTCGEISERTIDDNIVHDPSLARWVTPRSVRKIIAGMGFFTKRSNRGSQVHILDSRLQILKKRFGVDSDDSDVHVSSPTL
jgi:hypothetical protein